MRSGLCDEFSERKCREECGDDLLSWTCSQCEKKKATDLGEYTLKIFRLRLLKMGGYPFKPNALTVEEWEDLGRVEETMQAREKDGQFAALQRLLVQIFRQ